MNDGENELAKRKKKHWTLDWDKDEFSGKGGDAFVMNGFKNWNIPNRFERHEGAVNSIHNRAREKFDMLTKSKKSIQSAFKHQSTKSQKEYHSRLFASIHSIRYLLHQGLPTRGHDESQGSSNKGNFIELLEWLAKHNEEVEKVVLKNAPKNLKVTSSSIEKDITHACAKETTEAIIKELGEDYFAILADESADITHNEKISLCLQYAIYSLLTEHSLSSSKIRGQGYDGASNMKGESNGLKTLILKETTSAYYVHYFAHQHQLTIVVVSKKSINYGWLFDILTNLLNIIGVSCKRKEMLPEAQAQKVSQAFDDGQLESGKGLNQELSLGRPGDTRWGSHYKLTVNVISLYPVIREVLDKIGDVSSSTDDWLKVDVVGYLPESFDFIFMIHLMKTIFDDANDLNNALQTKDQDIVNAMSLVTLTRQRLQQVKDNGWEPLLSLSIPFEK
ncbi:uncharacterized protein LOC111913372 [Lactuca sativa]|uniref:uncharacterized protein LOC111913372 n=1 Tax=Lactuca sativa TaxID=4236 RepID=UPI000CD892B8|nr:uncharacterized protein LOC111913372 [Lactuca sativa]